VTAAVEFEMRRVCNGSPQFGQTDRACAYECGGTAPATACDATRFAGRSKEYASGTLCRTTPGVGGTVFKLTPPRCNAAWTKTVFHSFNGGSDGSDPSGGLIRDASGMLYGVTASGGTSGFGTVGRLAGSTEVVLHSFPLTDGSANTSGNLPVAGLTRDVSGVLYGTTYSGGVPCPRSPGGCGTVFKLTPPAAGKTVWIETVVHSFTGGGDGDGPNAGLTRGASGALYSTTFFGGVGCGGEGCGTVFKLTPPAPGKTAWLETVLYRFTGGGDGEGPNAGLTRDTSGALYGTTYYGGVGCGGVGCGTVFKRTPPAARKTAWIETVLYRFTGGSDGGAHSAGLIRDSGRASMARLVREASPASAAWSSN
jgi:uncharacterized repeat protein (TIGR03803 family)